MTDKRTQDKFFVVYSRTRGQTLNIHKSIEEAKSVAKMLAIEYPEDTFFILESTWSVHASPPTAVVNPIVATPSEVEQPVDISHLLQWRFDPGKAYWTAVSRHLRSDGVPSIWVITVSDDWNRFLIIDGPPAWGRGITVFGTKDGAMGYCQNIEDNMVGPA